MVVGTDYRAVNRWDDLVNPMTSPTLVGSRSVACSFVFANHEAILFSNSRSCSCCDMKVLFRLSIDVYEVQQ